MKKDVEPKKLTLRKLYETKAEAKKAVRGELRVGGLKICDYLDELVETYGDFIVHDWIIQPDGLFVAIVERGN